MEATNSALLTANCAGRAGRPARSARLFWLLCLIGAALVACRQSAATTGAPASDAAVTIELVAPLCSPPVGQGEVMVRLSDAAGAPLDDARLSLRGDMTHAGMIPMLAAAEGGQDGLYRVPVEWSMAGEWVLTVEAVLADDSRAVAEFDLSVGAEDEPCIEE